MSEIFINIISNQMAFINLGQIEKTIKENKDKVKFDEKMSQKKEERDMFSVKKLPKQSGNFNFRERSRTRPFQNYPPPVHQLSEYREGLGMVAKDLITQHCQKYGCNKEILKKELDESKDIKHYTDQYITLFDGLPDICKCGLTIFSKIGISKAGIDRYKVLKKEPLKNKIKK